MYAWSDSDSINLVCLKKWHRDAEYGQFELGSIPQDLHFNFKPSRTLELMNILDENRLSRLFCGFLSQIIAWSSRWNAVWKVAWFRTLHCWYELDEGDEGFKYWSLLARLTVWLRITATMTLVVQVRYYTCDGDGKILAGSRQWYWDRLRAPCGTQ